jgi:hypothetical protein
MCFGQRLVLEFLTFTLFKFLPLPHVGGKKCEGKLQEKRKKERKEGRNNQNISNWMMMCANGVSGIK